MIALVVFRNFYESCLSKTVQKVFIFIALLPTDIHQNLMVFDKNVKLIWKFWNLKRYSTFHLCHNFSFRTHEESILLDSNNSSVTTLISVYFDERVTTPQKLLFSRVNHRARQTHNFFYNELWKIGLCQCHLNVK